MGTNGDSECVSKSGRCVTSEGEGEIQISTNECTKKRGSWHQAGAMTSINEDSSSDRMVGAVDMQL